MTAAKRAAGGRASSPGPRSATTPEASSFLPLQLATLERTAPAGDEWLHEIKLDGFRILAARRGREVTLLTRTGQDWTTRFLEVAEAVAALPGKDVVLDGEVVVMRADGTTSFQALQNQTRGLKDGRLVYVAFDLLFADGEDLRPRPLETRKARLAKLLAGEPRGVKYSDHVIGEGPAFFAKAAAMKVEGIVSKRRADPYLQGRRGSWIKVKAMARQEVVVGGFTEPEGARTGLGALLVGFFEGAALRYAGKVGTGFGQSVARELRARLDALETERAPFDARIPAQGREVHWVRPELVVEVAYAEITDDGKLRHPSFQGVREDKPARDVTLARREPMPALAPAAKSPPSRARARRT